MGADVNLANLTTVGSIDVEDVANVELPVLSSVNGSLSINSTNVYEIRADQLDFVGGDLNIGDNLGLKQLSLQLLRVVKGNLNITGNPQLDTMTLPTLQEVGERMDFHGNFSG